MSLVEGSFQHFDVLFKPAQSLIDVIVVDLDQDVRGLVPSGPAGSIIFSLKLCIPRSVGLYARSHAAADNTSTPEQSNSTAMRHLLLRIVLP